MTGRHAVPVALTGSDQLVRTGVGTYYGFTIRETAGAVAKVQVFDGTSATGTLLETISLVANGSDKAFYPGGMWAANGIFVKILAGTVEGSLRLG